MFHGGIAQYASGMGLRYLTGCPSLNSGAPAEGWLRCRQLEPLRVPPAFEIVSAAAYACPTEQQRAHAQPSFCLPNLEQPLSSARSRFPAPLSQ